jgi:hypothetical protein
LSRNLSTDPDPTLEAGSEGGAPKEHGSVQGQVSTATVAPPAALCGHKLVHKQRTTIQQRNDILQAGWKQRNAILQAGLNYFVSMLLMMVH